MASIIGFGIGIGFDTILGIGGGGPPVGVLITADSTQHTIDTTTLYTVDNNNTTA